MTATATTPARARPGTRHVRVLTGTDVPEAARLLAHGFAEDPASVAFVPDPAQRVRLNELSSTRTLRAAIPHASVHGVDIDGALAGVAIWHPPGAATGSLAATREYAVSLLRELPALPPVAARLAASLISDRRAAARLSADRRRAVRKAGHGPTWHLAVLATDAAHRGQGLARLLLEHVLGRCDADGLAAWLETTNPVNPPIYERFGFGTIARIDGGRVLPTWWVMRRPPR